ncbi:plasma membrane-associated cation-binding protein 1-like [Aristolochia californica]|uniref:plasma membrane-associated cation-binding protein 1-like n=1 Tax=Aristolochia californica TaxID=171875 RepID=UPI0035DB6FC8
MGYWKSKVLPKISKVFGKNGKKSAAAEASKGFEESKEGINKEFEEKKAELQPKVIEIYEASSAEVKTVVKERKELGLKKNSAGVQCFLEELAKIDFPGSKTVSESSSQYGPTLVPGPVFFVFEKVSTFIVTEEKDTTTTTEDTAREIDAAAATEESSKEKDAASTTEEAGKEKEVVAEEKKEEGTEKEEVVAEKSEPVSSEPAKAVQEEAPKA